MLLPSFDERLEYLSLVGSVGEETFGSYRAINQAFYHSDEWKNIRKHIIARDCGCDLALPDRKIVGRIYVHHIVPITVYDVENYTDRLVSSDNLVCVSKSTHDLIHYGKDRDDPYCFAERSPNDTCLWK